MRITNNRKILKNAWVNLWEFDDPKLFPEAIVTRFLKNIRENEVDWHRNIVSHFHQSITDNQIQCVFQHFCGAFYHWGYTKFGTPNHFEVLIDLYFGNSDESKAKAIIFGIEPDLFYNEYRIVGVRILDSRWKVKKTVYAVDQSIYNWRTDQPDFGNPIGVG